jgi:hypothetical protein
MASPDNKDNYLPIIIKGQFLVKGRYHVVGSLFIFSTPPHRFISIPTQITNLLPAKASEP